MKFTKQDLFELIKEELGNLDYVADDDPEDSKDLETAISELHNLTQSLERSKDYLSLEKVEKVLHLIQRHRAEMLGL